MTEPAYQNVPRHDTRTEQGVLGAMILDRTGDTFDQITTILGGPLDFYHAKHGAIYEVLLEMRRQNAVIDPITVAEFVDDDTLRRIGGIPYLHTCIAAVMTVANGTYYARQVAELALLRNLETFGIRTQQRARTIEARRAGEALEQVQSDAASISMGAVHDLDLPRWDTVVTDAVDEMERIGQARGVHGIATGWSDLDRLLGGLRPGQLITIAGRPGMGKSVAGRGVLYNAARDQKLDSFLFTLEMSRNECAMAIIAAGAGVSYSRIRTGQLHDEDWVKIARHINDCGDAPVYIDDSSGVNLPRARQVLRRHIARGGKPRLVVWDYLQITPVPAGGRSRQEDVSNLSRDFKLLAGEFEIPVVLISQLNRGPETRTDKRPNLADLRESGSIEQDSDVVVFVHRDDYYDKESPRAGEADFIVAKHRGGPTDTVTVASQLHLQRFMDMAIM